MFKNYEVDKAKKDEVDKAKKDEVDDLFSEVLDMLTKARESGADPFGGVEVDDLGLLDGVEVDDILGGVADLLGGGCFGGSFGGVEVDDLDLLDGVEVADLFSEVLKSVDNGETTNDNGETKNDNKKVLEKNKKVLEKNKKVLEKKQIIEKLKIEQGIQKKKNQKAKVLRKEQALRNELNSANFKEQQKELSEQKAKLSKILKEINYQRDLVLNLEFPLPETLAEAQAKTGENKLLYFKDVKQSLTKDRTTFKAYIRNNGHCENIGTWGTYSEAVQAYDYVMKKLHPSSKNPSSNTPPNILFYKTINTIKNDTLELYIKMMSTRIPKNGITGPLQLPTFLPKNSKKAEVQDLKNTLRFNRKREV